MKKHKKTDIVAAVSSITVSYQYENDKIHFLCVWVMSLAKLVRVSLWAQHTRFSNLLLWSLNMTRTMTRFASTQSEDLWQGKFLG